MTRDHSALTPEFIASRLDLKLPQLEELANDLDSHYWAPRMKMVKGKPRPIEVPKPHLMGILKKLHRFMQWEFPTHPMVHGGIRERSCFTSARTHVGSDVYIVTRDIRDCYPSITPSMLLEEFRLLGVPCEAAQLLTRLLTCRGHVPQGAPASGDALNIMMGRVDQRLASVCGIHGASPSRCHDDIVVSTSDASRIDAIGNAIEAGIEMVGLAISVKKRNRHGLQKPFHVRKVHNLVILPRGVGIEKKHANKVVDWAVEYVRAARSVDADSLYHLAAKRRRLFGHRCHFQQADRSPASHLMTLLKQGDRLITERLMKDGVCGPRFSWQRATATEKAVLAIADQWREVTSRTSFLVSA